MKILFISPRYRGGGAERCARELFLGMRERGHTTEMWTAVPETDVPEGVQCVRPIAERLLFPVNYVDPIADWRHISTRRKLDAIQPGDFDVIHLHNIHGNWISIKGLHRLCQRMPVVWTLHDEWAATGGVPYDLSRWPSLKDRIGEYRKHSPSSLPLSSDEPIASTWKHFLAATLPPVSAVISPSRYVLDLAGNRFHPELSTLNHIPNASQVHLRRSQDHPVAWAIPADRPCILYIAANPMSPFKGGDLAIEALNKLVATTGANGFSLLVLGRQAEEFQRLLPPTIACTTGYANSEAELMAAYRASKVTLLPSIAENYPYVALESLHAGIPVVGFRVGGLPEIIQNAAQGELVTPFDTSDMADSLARILARPKLDVQDQQSMTAGLSDFPQFLDRIEEVYQSCRCQPAERCASGSVA